MYAEPIDLNFLMSSNKFNSREYSGSFLSHFTFKRSIALGFIFFVMFMQVKSQDFIRDTVFVSFGTQTNYAIDFSCDSIIDCRKIAPNVLYIEQASKYIIKYYDIYYSLKDKLAKELFSTYKWDRKGTKIKLEIERFEVKGFSKKDNCGKYVFSQIAVSEINDTGSVYKGTMVHEISKQNTFPFPSDTLPAEYPIEAWKYQFAKDMNALNTGKLPGNFYTQKVGPDFIPRTFIHIGLKSLIVDGEFWFSNPESNRSFSSKSYKLRYRNASEFESIGFPLVNNTSYYRLNNNFMLLSNYSLFMGINRWKDYDKRKLGFQDILHANVSASQGIILHPKLTRGIVAGIGITEDIVGIYKQKMLFEPALFILVGIKL